MNFLKKIADILHHTTSCELPAESKQSGAPTHDVSGDGVPSSLRYEVSDDHIVITGCSAKEISVVIPAEIEGLPVTIINSTSFAQHKLIKKIVIPDSVTLIGNHAFLESGLTSVKMSRSVTFIASGAFKKCTELIDITFPDALQKIGPDAFCGCKSLARVVLPASLKELDDTSIFSHCTALTSVTFRSGVEVIPNFTFFCDSALTEVILPDTLKEIRMSAFNKCTALEKITLPDSLKTIGINAFSECISLKEITIPASVTLIKEYAFSDCSSLESVIIENPECEIDDSRGTISNGTETVNDKRRFCFSGTIYGAAGSTAEAYAEKHGYKFECI